MAKRTVELSEEQKRRNAEILARLEADLQKLKEDTRRLQLQERGKPGRKRRKQETTAKRGTQEHAG